MIRKLSAFIVLLLASAANAQTVYPSVNISLVGHIAPNTTTPTVARYSGCWGWHQSSKNREYAISGTSNGVYFIDVTNPANPVVSGFVAGRNNSLWREMKTYQNYCYIVSDDAAPNKFQIVDMQYLPDSVHLVYEGTSLFERGHTIWIDGDKMYVASMTYSTGTYKPMGIFSLATPTAPVLLRTLDQDVANNLIPVVHDMYVRHDTIFASAAYQGLWILKLDPATPTITVLGSYTGYPDAGYNHSSFLTQDRKYLMFCDEVPGERPIHFVNVENFQNVQPVKDFKPTLHTTAHNPYMLGNKWAIVSCYQDGLYIYDISKPDTIKQKGYFDTYPQGGANTGSYGGGAYNGNWGAYPFLPSGIIVANDMANGVFLLDATAAFNSTVSNPVGVTATDEEAVPFVYPNPAGNWLRVSGFDQTNDVIRVTDMLGREMPVGVVARGLDISLLSEGSYIAEITRNGSVTRCRFIKSN